MLGLALSSLVTRAGPSAACPATHPLELRLPTPMLPAAHHPAGAEPVPVLACGRAQSASSGSHRVEAVSVAASAGECPAGALALALPAGHRHAQALCVEGDVEVPPSQNKLALAGRSGMSFTWSTDGDLTDIGAYSPTILYGTDPEALDGTATGESSQYTDMSWQHSVDLQGLEPGQTYFYQNGDPAQGMAAEVRQFTVPPSSGSFQAFVIGDMGVLNSNATAARMFEASPDLFLHVGDISYADDRASIGKNPQYETVYDQWGELVENVTARYPYMTACGNHDIDALSDGLDFGRNPQLGNYSAYLHRFTMPHAYSGAPANVYYSFDVGRTHFTVVNTESDYPGAPSTTSTRIGPAGGGFGDQLAWVEQDLAAAAEARAAGDLDWMLVVGHRTPYADQHMPDFPPGQQKRTRAAFEPLLNQYGVDVFLAGHVHAYESSCAAFAGQCSDNGTVYIVNGAAGNIEGHTQFADTPLDIMRYRNDEDYGYGLLDVNETALRWQFRRSEDGEVLDEVVLSSL